MVLPQKHSYGPKCRLAPFSYPPETDPGLHDIPPLAAHFFYSSLIPIDDPLALAPIPDAKSSARPNAPQRPFSLADNNALERAWLSFPTDHDREAHTSALRNTSLSPGAASGDAVKIKAICRHLVRKHRTKYQNHPPTPSTAVTPAVVPVCCPELRVDASNELRRVFCALHRRRRPGLDEDTVITAVMAELTKLGPLFEIPGQQTIAATATTRAESNTPVEPIFGSIPSIFNESGTVASSLPAARIGRPDRRGRRDNGTESSRSSINRTSLNMPGMKPKPSPIPIRPPPVDDGITGSPFARAGTPDMSTGMNTPVGSFGPTTLANGNPDATSTGPVQEAEVETTEGDVCNEENSEAWQLRGQPVEVPVGVSRLHMVSLPLLQMKPIYWSPVNDITIVTRATWFYRDTMAPVEPKVANQLEASYRELGPWSEAWSDELRCAVDVGALGEEKVVQPLWPKHAHGGSNSSAGNTLPFEPSISDDPYCAARCFRGAASAEGTLDAVQKEDDGSVKSYANYHVLYRNAKEAFLLKPSHKPSAYYNRRPVSKIVKGMTVGIPVVRGFDSEAWHRIQEPRGSKATQPQTYYIPPEAPDSNRQAGQGSSCAACSAEADRWRVTDLVLVAHGIGQKFAERVESFHFTHAINAFRRAVNVEQGKNPLNGGRNGLMVLPINWRHKLSFEDGGPMQAEDQAAPDTFTLKDIEPRTIPAVRSMISDVMFDIPFYMSHHKPKMVSALVGEANRVYRLWCANNPGFAQPGPGGGRVHLIAHSLGSVMAIEVLSNQPTITPPLADPTAPTASETTEAEDSKHFAFDTKNLFLLGSPAGFFLLLERGQLMPRRGRAKPGSDPADDAVAADRGVFGCLAVDNVYNILAREDPIAYLLNGTVDVAYAASLRPAFVPSTSTSLLQSVKGLFISTPATAPHQPARPTIVAARLPSQLELEVHDFSREEAAERKAYLLNDNGQIDYLLRSAGGPIEMQYLNMLSAHSSYWTSADLVRMMCMEIGRPPGRANTLPELRAVKAGKRVIPGAK